MEKRKRKSFIRSTVARAMAVVMAVTAVSGSIFSIPARAEDGAYPYMIFAASDGEGAVTFRANNVGLNGSVATNGTVAVIGGNCNINGTRTERAGEGGEPVGMPDLRERIEHTYFAAGTEEHAQDYALEEININVNTPIEGNGEVSLSGNINLNAGIMAQEDIVLDGEVKNSGDVALYSASGNIILDSTNVNLNGLAYAPYGEIRITAMNVNMNNVILIAQKVTVEANGINGGMNQGMAQFIGTEYNILESGGGTEDQKPENPDPENPRDPSELMQGIVRYEATGGLEDIGEAYFKDITSIDDIGYTVEGYPCVKNQLLLTAKEGTAFAQIEELAHSYDAEIVGYLELTGDYQIEFYEDHTPEELSEMQTVFGQSPLIQFCDCHLVMHTEADFITSDTEWAEEWDTQLPKGHNWGVELIDLEGALVNAGVIADRSVSSDEADLSGLTPVKIGLIDTAFDQWHPDLKNQFVEVWNNYGSQEELRGAYSLSSNELLKLYHGTHVAGIMAAEYDNGVGITGVCLKPELYGFATVPERNEKVAGMDATMRIKYMLYVMVRNHIRVINYSMGFYGEAFAASQGEQWAIDILSRRAAAVEQTLSRLYLKGYDFLIVTAAGNANDAIFLKYINDKGLEGYVLKSEYNYYIQNGQMQDFLRKYGELVSSETYGAYNSGADHICKDVEARFSNEFTFSQKPFMTERVIVVGALNPPTIVNGAVHNISATLFSAVGDRVDIYAPGKNIWSCGITAEGREQEGSYIAREGTSMASPYVAGVAGLAYNVNPDISAPELKQAITDHAFIYNNLKILNAADVIAAVTGYETPDEPEEYTVQLHVTDADGNEVSDAAVEVRNRTSYWCKVLGAAMISDAVGGTVVCNGRTDADGNIKLDIPQGHYYVMVDGEYGGVLDEIYVSSEDIIEKSVKEISMPDYLPDETRGVILQLGSRTAGENVSSYGFIMHAEIRFIKGWMDTEGKEDIRLEDYVRKGSTAEDGEQPIAVYHTRETLGDISAQLPEGKYTVEITLPDAEPQYYRILVSDKYDFMFYRFDM